MMSEQQRFRSEAILASGSGSMPSIQDQFDGIKRGPTASTFMQLCGGSFAIGATSAAFPFPWSLHIGAIHAPMHHSSFQSVGMGFQVMKVLSCCLYLLFNVLDG